MFSVDLVVIAEIVMLRWPELPNRVRQTEVKLVHVSIDRNEISPVKPEWMLQIHYILLKTTTNINIPRYITSV